MCDFGYLIWLTACHSFQLDWLTACMFHLDLDSPLLLFQIKSVETRLPCCVVHWLGAAGNILPTGPMYIHMSKDNTLELLQSCTKPSLMWKISTGECKKDVTPLLMHWSYVFLVLTLVLLSIWIFKTFWPLIFQLATLTPWMALMGWWDSELIACWGKASREHSRCLSSVEANNVDAEKWTFLAPWGCAVRAHLMATGKRKQGRGLFQYKWPSF